MKATRVLLIALLAVVAANCGEQSPTGVTASSIGTPAATRVTTGRENSVVGDLLGGLGLLKCSPLPYDSASTVIGPWGGALRVGPQTLYVPPGALSHNVTITGVLSANTVNAIRFSPQGLTFNRPAYLTMTYANCNLLGRLLPKRIAYTTDLFQILEYILSIDNIFAKSVTGQVNHFSQYAVAW